MAIKSYKPTTNGRRNMTALTYAEITANADDRIFLTNFKAAYDTIQYSIAYALIPVFIGFGIMFCYRHWCLCTKQYCSGFFVYA